MSHRGSTTARGSRCTTYEGMEGFFQGTRTKSKKGRKIKPTRTFEATAWQLQQIAASRLLGKLLPTVFGQVSCCDVSRLIPAFVNHVSQITAPPPSLFTVSSVQRMDTALSLIFASLRCLVVKHAAALRTPPLPLARFFGCIGPHRGLYTKNPTGRVPWTARWPPSP